MQFQIRAEYDGSAEEQAEQRGAGRRGAPAPAGGAPAGLALRPTRSETGCSILEHCRLVEAAANALSVSMLRDGISHAVGESMKSKQFSKGLYAIVPNLADEPTAEIDADSAEQALEIFGRQRPGVEVWDVIEMRRPRAL
jgi:hypothetical protein